MFAVIFEVKPKSNGKDEYLKIASELRAFLENREGFISIERFKSITEEGKVLSLSFWKDEVATEKWERKLVSLLPHSCGRNCERSYGIKQE